MTQDPWKQHVYYTRHQMNINVPSQGCGGDEKDPGVMMLGQLDFRIL